MIYEVQQFDSRPTQLEQDQFSSRIVMGNGRMSDSRPVEMWKNKTTEYRRSFSGGRRVFAGGKSYFSVESMVLLVCLTASLLILPVVLPPLPPPPLMLLLLPIGLLGVLLILAFMPSANVRDVTYTYV